MSQRAEERCVDVSVGSVGNGGQTTCQEWVADTDPTNALACLRIESISYGAPVGVLFHSSSNRLYTLRSATNLTAGGWSDVLGQVDVPGTGGLHCLTDTDAAPAKFYRVVVRVP